MTYGKKENRTKTDFSKHVLNVTEVPGLLIHDFAIPNTVCQRITFLHIRNEHVPNILIVTGDYGRWTFNRDFVPSVDNMVSDSYWCEKLRIGSTQKSHVYSSEVTGKLIQEELKTLEEDKDDHSAYEYENLKSYYESLLNYCDCGEEEYVFQAYWDDSEPGRRLLDPENIPLGKEVDIQLQVVFDAFDEICNRMRKEQESKNA